MTRPCCPKKHHNKVYYWVPCAFKLDFFKLSLYTVALRGQPTPFSPEFEVTVKGFKNIQPNGVIKGAYDMVMKIDKKIPNDTGFMIATVKGRIYDKPSLFQIRPNPAANKPQDGKEGSQAG